MITAQEAFEATNPALSQEQREKAALNILSGVAANDAYINSRTELEQVVIRAQGGQAPPPHDQVAADAANASAIQGTAQEEVAAIAAKAGGEVVHEAEVVADKVSPSFVNDLKKALADPEARSLVKDAIKAAESAV